MATTSSGAVRLNGFIRQSVRITVSRIQKSKYRGIENSDLIADSRFICPKKKGNATFGPRLAGSL